MNKKIKWMLIVLSFLLAITFSSCNKVSEKVGNKVSEKILEDASGGEVEVTNDGMSIKNEDLSIETGTSMEWPTEFMGDLPKPKANISGIMKGKDNISCSVTYSKFENADAKQYFVDLQSKGYNQSYQLEDKDTLTFSGQNEKGSTIYFTYNTSTKDGIIMLDNSTIPTE